MTALFLRRKERMKKIRNILLAVLILSLCCGSTAYAMDARRYKVVAKGSTLVGYTRYRSKAGSNRVKRLGDSPRYLCCSSFASWAYSKAGVARIDYSTWDFCHSKRFRRISKRRLKIGDIGLITDSRRAGNHVAIYVGRRARESLWLHCTGHGGRNGVVVSTDKRIKVYYRYRGFKD